MRRVHVNSIHRSLRNLTTICFHFSSVFSLLWYNYLSCVRFVFIMIRPTKSMEIHKNIIILYILYVCMWLISMFGLLSHCRMIISGNFLGTTEDSNHADKNLECRFAANPEYPLHNLICTEYPNYQHKRISFKTALSLGNSFIYSAPKHPPTHWS